MSPERYQQVKRVFEQVADLPFPERPAALTRLAGADAELRREVEQLLASDRSAGAFMAQPALAPLGRIVPQAPRTSLLGSRIGPYEILSEIGRGGMGTVYLASRADDQFRKLVALKIVNPAAETESMAARFRRERQILANLEHPNIAQLLDGGTAPDGSPYLVMEYVGGMPIDEYCDSRRLPVRERLALIRIVCSAVHYAHQNLVVHRDLKPTNILVKADGSVKLLDFGIAKLLNPDPMATPIERTATSMRIMTPEYASPEQARGGSVTTSSDVYSLGIVSYELLTGGRPWQAITGVLSNEPPETPSRAVSRTTEQKLDDGSVRRRTPETVAAERRTSARALRRVLAGDLDAILLRAIERDPARRYHSAERLADDIQRHLDLLPVSARGDAFSYRLSRVLLRHKAATAIFVLVLLLLGAAGGVFNHQVADARSRQQQAEKELERTRGELEQLRRQLAPPR